MQLILKSGALVLALTAWLMIATTAWAQTAPKELDLSELEFDIVDAHFVDEMQGLNATFTESQPDKYRGLVLTIEIEKPAGEELTVYVQDLVLHYTYGDVEEITPCWGISVFSADKNVDRPMYLYTAGIGGSTTGLATTDEDVVFADLFFQFMEPDTEELHLFVAQPVGASYTCDGW